MRRGEALALLAAPLLSAAAPASVAEIANYRGADRRALLEAGARSEGTITLYATGTQLRPLLDRFQQHYPFLHVQTYNAGTTEVASKATQEYAAHRYDVDGFELDASGLLAMKEQGVLQPFWTPELTAFGNTAIEVDHTWVIVRESYVGLGYNTKLLRGQDAPRTYHDLLDPRWKGKLAINGVIATAANWIGVVEMADGPDFPRALAAQDVRVYQVTARALANLVIAGEVMLSPTIYSSHVQSSRLTGAPIAWRALGPSFTEQTGVALAAHAPHPHAMLLLADFLFSAEGQRMYRELGYSTTRRDVPSPTPNVQRAILWQRPTYFTEFREWAATYQQLFLK